MGSFPEPPTGTVVEDGLGVRDRVPETLGVAVDEVVSVVDGEMVAVGVICDSTRTRAAAKSRARSSRAAARRERGREPAAARWYDARWQGTAESADTAPIEKKTRARSKREAGESATQL